MVTTVQVVIIAIILWMLCHTVSHRLVMLLFYMDIQVPHKVENMVTEITVDNGVLTGMITLVVCIDGR